MKVKIRNLGVDMEVKNKGTTLDVYKPDGKTRLAAFMHRSLIMGACRRGVGFFEKPAQGDPPRRFSVAEMV